MKYSIFVKISLSVLMLTLFNSLLIPGVKADSNDSSYDNNFVTIDYAQRDAKERNLANFFNVVSSIPDEVLENGNVDEVNSYLKPFDDNGISDRSIWSCSLAIGGVTVSTVAPVGKIIKIKKLIAELGGGLEAAKILVGASTAAEKWTAVGTAGGTLIGELSGFTSIKTECLS